MNYEQMVQAQADYIRAVNFQQGVGCGFLLFFFLAVASYSYYKLKSSNEECWVIGVILGGLVGLIFLVGGIGNYFMFKNADLEAHANIANYHFVEVKK